MQKIAVIPLGIVGVGITLTALIYAYPLSFGVNQDSVSWSTGVPTIFAAGVGVSIFLFRIT